MHGGTTLASYSYPLDRLLTAQSTALSEQFTFDGVGNRTSWTNNNRTTTYVYNAGNELASSTTGGTTTTYSYDADGNLTASSTGLALAYNAKNQTNSITPPGGGTTTFSYTGPNQTERVKETGDTFTNSGLGVSSQTDSSGTAYYIRDNTGNLVDEELPGGSRYYYLFDGLGSVIGLTDSTGSLVATYGYDIYGRLNGGSGQVANPWRFAGGYYDTSTGYYKFGLRYDDPTTGRWTQQDPIGGSLFDPGSQNRYTYAGDNPVNFVDPTGAGILQNVILACAVGVTGAALVSAFAFAAFGQFELSIFDLAFGCVTSAATQLYLDQGNYVAAGETAVAGTIESLLSIISTFGG